MRSPQGLIPFFKVFKGISNHSLILNLINIKRERFSYSEFNNLVVSSTTFFKFWGSFNDSLSSNFKLKGAALTEVTRLAQNTIIFDWFSLTMAIFPRIYSSEIEFDFSSSLSNFSLPLQISNDYTSMVSINFTLFKCLICSFLI